MTNAMFDGQERIIHCDAIYSIFYNLSKGKLGRIEGKDCDRQTFVAFVNKC